MTGLTDVVELVADATLQVAIARKHRLPMSAIGLAIDLTQAVVEVESAVKRSDVPGLTQAVERLRRLNEGLAGGRTKAGA